MKSFCFPQEIDQAKVYLEIRVLCNSVPVVQEKDHRYSPYEQQAESVHWFSACVQVTGLLFFPDFSFRRVLLHYINREHIYCIHEVSVDSVCGDCPCVL
jgi:hypothetical protein